MAAVRNAATTVSSSTIRMVSTGVLVPDEVCSRAPGIVAFPHSVRTQYIIKIITQFKMREFQNCALLACSPRFVTNIMRDLSFVVIKVTNCVVDLRQGNTLRISNFFRVLTRLEEKDNVTY